MGHGEVVEYWSKLAGLWMCKAEGTGLEESEVRDCVTSAIGYEITMFDPTLETNTATGLFIQHVASIGLLGLQPTDDPDYPELTVNLDKIQAVQLPEGSLAESALSDV